MSPVPSVARPRATSTTRRRQLEGLRRYRLATTSSVFCRQYSSRPAKPDRRRPHRACSLDPPQSTPTPRCPTPLQRSPSPDPKPRLANLLHLEKAWHRPQPRYSPRKEATDLAKGREKESHQYLDGSYASRCNGLSGRQK